MPIDRGDPDHITDGPQTPEDAAEYWGKVFDDLAPKGWTEPREAMECPMCGEIALYPQADNYPMWECDACHREVQIKVGTL